MPHARDRDCMVAVAMAEDESGPRTRVEHPNRRKASSKATRLLVIVLLLVSAALVLIVTIGGWSALQGPKAPQVAYIAVYVLLAFFVFRWSRGVLPLIAALIVPVQLLLIAVSMSGFRQAWNVEIGRRADDESPREPRRGRGSGPS